MQSVSNGTFSAVGVSFIGCGWACTSSFFLSQNFPDKNPNPDVLPAASHSLHGLLLMLFFYPHLMPVCQYMEIGPVILSRLLPGLLGLQFSRLISISLVIISLLN